MSGRMAAQTAAWPLHNGDVVGYVVGYVSDQVSGYVSDYVVGHVVSDVVRYLASHGVAFPIR